MAKMRQVWGKVPPTWFGDAAVFQLEPDARWLLVALRVLVAQEASVILPAQYTPSALGHHAMLHSSRIQKCLSMLARGGWVALTSDGRLAVLKLDDDLGRIRQMRGAVVDYPPLTNPWATAPLYSWPGAGVAPAAPSPPPPAAKKPKEKGASPWDKNPLEDHPVLDRFWPELMGFVKERTPHFRVPKPGTKGLFETKRELLRLVEIDKHRAVDVVAALRWMHTSRHEDALFWRPNLISPRRYRVESRLGGVTKFSLMLERWKKVGRLEPVEFDPMAAMTPEDEAAYKRLLAEGSAAQEAG